MSTCRVKHLGGRARERRERLCDHRCERMAQGCRLPACESNLSWKRRKERTDNSSSVPVETIGMSDDYQQAAQVMTMWQRVEMKTGSLGRKRCLRECVRLPKAAYVRSQVAVRANLLIKGLRLACTTLTKDRCGRPRKNESNARCD